MRPEIVLINLEMSVQNGAVIGQDHHMCNKVPSKPHALQQNLEEEGDMWVSLTCVRYQQRGILRDKSR